MGEKRYYLAVPFQEKEQAKALGAHWDWQVKKWYVTDPESPACNRWPIRDLKLPLIFPGEDREWGSSRLFVDLVPSSCWFTNVRSAVKAADWDILRKHIYARAGNRCEICGAEGRLEAHERWFYDEKRGVQVLKRLIALCPNCHLATHFGLAQLKGLEEQAFAHLQRVNKWTRAEAEKHVEEAFQVWEERSKRVWALDLSMLELAGFQVQAPDAHERKNIAQEKQQDEPFERFRKL